MAAGERASGTAKEMKAETTGRGPLGVNEAAERRLRNIAGQVEGIRRMVQEEKYCIDILTQIAAVRAALSAAGQVILRRHIEVCASEAFEKGGDAKQAVVDELMAVFARGET